MIKRIFTREELEKALQNTAPDIFSGKIKALALAYGFEYPFLRFFCTENNTVIGAYYGSAVVSGAIDEEILHFCLSLGCGEVLFPGIAETPLERLNIMEYKGNPPKSGNTPLCTDTPYSCVFDILKEGFDISFDEWYTDTCHNVRHGISKVFTLENNATAQKMFTVDGISLVSLVAVKKAARKNGTGSRLIQAVSALLAKDSRVFVICEDKLVPFYIKNGYEKTGYCTQINIKGEN